MHEAHRGILVGEAEVFDGLYHLCTHPVMPALVLASTWSQSGQPIAPEARMIVP